MLSISGRAADQTVQRRDGEDEERDQGTEDERQDLPGREVQHVYAASGPSRGALPVPALLPSAVSNRTSYFPGFARVMENMEIHGIL